MNNALVPAGLVVNLVIWNRDADLGKLLLGGCHHGRFAMAEPLVAAAAPVGGELS